MSGKYGTSYAGAESVGVSDCNKICWGTLVWLAFDSKDQWKRQDFKGVKRDIFGVPSCSHDFYPVERCVWIDLGGLPLASWLQSVLREEDVLWGGNVILWTPLSGEIRDDSVLYNDGCLVFVIDYYCPLLVTSGIRARLGPVVARMVFPRLDPDSTVLVDLGKPCSERNPVKGEVFRWLKFAWSLGNGLTVKTHRFAMSLVIMETHGRKKVVGEQAPPARDPRGVETIERL
ncbi:hypothetical protein Tco_0261867 [Tanacetum coccineum]